MCQRCDEGSPIEHRPPEPPGAERCAITVVIEVFEVAGTGVMRCKSRLFERDSVMTPQDLACDPRVRGGTRRDEPLRTDCRATPPRRVSTLRRVRYKSCSRAT